MEATRHTRPYFIGFNFYEISRIDNSLETESTLVSARACGWGVTANGHEDIWGVIKSFKMFCDDSCTILWIH